MGVTGAGTGRFSDFPFDQAVRAPDSPAVVFDGLRWTYGELAHRIEECAKGLLACGIGPGDRVAMLSSPRPEYAVVFLATARVGAIWVGLNPVQQLEEYRYILGDTRPSVVFAFERLRDRDNGTILRTLRAEFPDIRHFVLFDGRADPFLAYDAFIERGRGVADQDLAATVATVRPGDTALIVYTSGSTGKPKGAMLTQNNIAHWTEIYRSLWTRSPLRVACNLPVTHVGCCVETVAFTLAAGGTIVFQEHFDAGEFLALIQRERITWTPLVATMFQRILALPDWEKFDTTSMEGVLFGGTALPLDMIAKLRRLAPRIDACWGMTESTGALTFTREGDTPEILSRSVGKGEPSHVIAIMGTDGTLLPQGSEGEVVVRGPCVFAGYYRMPEATREILDAEGWLHSGDLGRFDSESRLYIVGRIKDMFKSGGYNVYPREVEIAIEAHPAVSLAVVVPVPDPTYQEVGFAYVVPAPGQKLTEQELARHCRARLANYKVPKRFFVRTALPMLAVGKIDKKALEAEARAVASGRRGPWDI